MSSDFEAKKMHVCSKNHGYEINRQWFVSKTCNTWDYWGTDDVTLDMQDGQMAQSVDCSSLTHTENTQTHIVQGSEQTMS